jgi:hypothetical protein
MNRPMQDRKPEDFQIGAWSKAIDGVQGRLLASPDTPFNGTRMVAVYVELRNVSDVANPMDIYYDFMSSFRGKVVDARSQELPAASLPTNIMSPLPCWLALPNDGLLRFPVSVHGYGVPRNGGVMLSLPNNAWLIPSEKAASCFINGAFTAPPKKAAWSQRNWHGTLELPNVKMPPLR